MGKKVNFLIIATIFSIFLFNLISANLELNSSNYSGQFTAGSSGGNITNALYAGDSASFFQQATGYLNDLFFSGIHSFSFAVAEFTGYAPSLSIVEPENETYIKTTNLPLNFTYLNSLYKWYKLDNGANVTITGNTTFNTTNGLHTLYLFANNTYGNSSANVTFTVNASKFHVHYDNYHENGSSTDFNESTYEEMQNLSGIVLERSNDGKIVFNQGINLTDDADYSNDDLNLDLYTNISHNSIEINSTVLSNLNKSATLYLYNLTFTNPRVLKDGSVCPSTVCTEASYSAGVFIFNVTGFTAYRAEETPTEAGGETGGATAPGGGGGSVTTTPVFAIDKSQISVTLNPGSVKTEEIVITNTGKKVISIKIENLFTDFIARGEDFVVMNPGESKAIPLYVLARVDTIPDLYLGKIIISSGSQKKEILIAIEVESEGALLDVRAEILNKNKKVLAGEDVLSEITLFNLGGEGRKDVNVEVTVKDYEGNEISKETESMAIETQLTFLERIVISEDTPLGNYVLYVKTTYEDKIASASDNFKVVSSITTAKEKLYIVIIIILSVILSLVVYLMIVHRGRVHGKSAKRTEKRVGLKSLMK